MDNCVFCNIVKKIQGAKPLFENDRVIVIQDILPKAPIHLLIIPKKHIPSIAVLEAADETLVGELVVVGKQMAEQSKIASSGYKLIFNVGHDGGQVINHLHLHLLGGKKLPE
jgi:histidine triad (HIT) family protein